MTHVMGHPRLKRSVLGSRLGSCWKCMSLTAGCLIGSIVLLFVAAGWAEIEGQETAFNHVLYLCGLVGTFAFSLLALAHLTAFILRRSLWRERH